MEPSAPTAMETLLDALTEVAPSMWDEVGFLLSFLLDQPILLLAMSIFFIGGIVAFFIRIYHSV